MSCIWWSHDNTAFASENSQKQSANDSIRVLRSSFLIIQVFQKNANQFKLTEVVKILEILKILS